MRFVRLTQGFVAVVDDEDYLQVAKFNWTAVKKKRKVYARRRLKANGVWTSEYLHHFILLGVPRVDHRDGDGLNNCRRNLRPASKQQNARAHCSKPEASTSKFRGVSFYRRGKNWEAKIWTGIKTLHLGRFDSETDAARAYDVAALKIFGEYAAPNFI